METALKKLEENLKELKSVKYAKQYFVPSLWFFAENGKRKTENGISVKPASFFLERIKKIHELAESAKLNLPGKDWTAHAVIYNMFVRYTTAYDHDANGRVDIHTDEHTFRETGTFLKSIALLPYLHSLGVNTVYMLPITSIGIDGKKGNLGSPYAIRNPYKLDDNLAETAIGLTVDEQFCAFVEAAHLLGMKVVLEFVFRTASKDSDLALEHPEWFYWIKEKVKDREHGSIDEKKYGSPVFTMKELTEIKEKVLKNELIKLPVPHREYLDLFTDIPNKVARVDEKIIGVLGEIEKKSCRIPGAFADWPPDDIQPAWTDVTYLRLYGHPNYNYIAYNTVRMYEQRLEQSQYRIRSLWDNICNIIPYYQQNFCIDGVMIDMGHALPHELRSMIVETARKINPDFVFWEENFQLTKKSVKDGYNAAVGYLPFDIHLSYKVKSLLKLLSVSGSPIPFFGTAETHNTHRTASREGGIAFSKFSWALINFLPSIPFILTGFELGEKNSVNTGLCFEEYEQREYPAEKLPLFSVGNLNWDNDLGIIDFIKIISGLRTKYVDCNENYNPKTFQYLETSSEHIIVFTRKFNEKRIIFLGNMSSSDEIYFSVKVKEKFKIIRDLFTGKVINIANGWIINNLKPFEFVIGIIEEQNSILRD